MNLFGFNILSKEEQKRQDEQLYNWAYPFKERQKAIVDELIVKTINDKNTSMSIYNYLVAKQICLETNYCNNDYTKLYSAIHSKIVGYDTRNIAKYVALVKVDSQVKEDLIYPSVEEILNLAAEIEKSIKK